MRIPKKIENIKNKFMLAVDEFEYYNTLNLYAGNKYTMINGTGMFDDIYTLKYTIEEFKKYIDKYLISVHDYYNLMNECKKLFDSSIYMIKRYDHETTRKENLIKSLEGYLTLYDSDNELSSFMDNLFVLRRSDSLERLFTRDGYVVNTIILGDINDDESFKFDLTGKMGIAFSMRHDERLPIERESIINNLNLCLLKRIKDEKWRNKMIDCIETALKLIRAAKAKAFERTLDKAVILRYSEIKEFVKVEEK